MGPDSDQGQASGISPPPQPIAPDPTPDLGEPTSGHERVSPHDPDSGPPMGRPNPARQRTVVALTTVALITGVIWYLQSNSLPFQSGAGDGRATQTATDDTPGAGFVAFASQGVKLGAADGPPPRVGQLAPEFALQDLDGTVLHLSDLRGKTVVMNFWATWCPPCRKEFPELVRLHEQNTARGLVVLGVNIQENAEIVRRFTSEFGARFPIVIDAKGDVSAQYRLRGLPMTLFIDAEGVLRSQHIGELTREILARKLSETGFNISSAQ
ncbi:MAG: TlpA family protein disulfide reductase [Dehalococcoidia bacterium]